VPNYSDQLPFEAVRDLLGIARAMYAAAKAEGAGERRLTEIAQAGKDLRLALGLARRTAPGALGHRRAWELAEQAYRRLLEQISVTTSLEPVIAAAIGRIDRPPPDPSRQQREQRRVARKVRS
jgi:hypothetical protein